MGDYNAVSAGTDLPRYARELSRMHDALIGGSRPAMRPRPLVHRSWQRALGLGLSPDRPGDREPVGAEALEQSRRRSPLRLVIDDLDAALSSVADASAFLMVVTDADGTILWRRGASAVRRRADTIGFAEVAQWAERTVGTNAIGTALTEAAPVQLFSAEHFEQAQHAWYCTAFPIHDPRTGALLGIVDVSGPALTLHPAIGALVQTAALLAQAQLHRYHGEALQALRARAVAVMGAARGPVLLVDDDGWVADSVGVTTRDRVAVPDADRPLAVPGLGLCLAEPLEGGWLVRPAARPGGSAIRAHLELGPAPTVQVHSGDTPWRVAVTARHAQILRALAEAGPAGLTAARLSTILFGDAAHAVAVRAEISRLRRTLGAIVQRSPYRIAQGVELTVSALD